ncbi:MAG TPA: septal ring lytic transglycosylase RlpA family protein [Bryobacteraceae bacterium]|nr:septal ring lytic transglycosylase RlpA family protein [Bryobacteraceae bacterium]
MRSRAFLMGVAVVLLLSGCGKKKPQAAIPRPAGWQEKGIASWYGNPYHGRAAANGEIYDMEKLTAAHRTLPFDTWVRVRNLSNGKTVEVRITDRGPFVGDRIIDLSRAAARNIDMIGPGIVNVRLQVIAPPRYVQPVDYFAVQVGAFQERKRAERLRQEMEKRYGPARVVIRDGKPPLWRVLVGRAPTLEAANGIAEQLRAARHSAFVVRLDDPAM